MFVIRVASGPEEFNSFTPVEMASNFGRTSVRSRSRTCGAFLSTASRKSIRACCREIIGTRIPQRHLLRLGMRYAQKYAHPTFRHVVTALHSGPLSVRL